MKAHSVELMVIITLKAKFPFEKYVNKFEVVPAGTLPMIKAPRAMKAMFSPVENGNKKVTIRTYAVNGITAN
jgi:hypothetical protein